MSPTIPTVRVGAVYPEAELTAVVATGLSGIDLSTATAAEFRLSRRGPSCAPDTQLAWAADITEQSAGSLTCKRELESGDADVLGVYDVLVALTVPDGLVRVDLGQLQIASFFGQGMLFVGGEVVTARPVLSADVTTPATEE